MNTYEIREIYGADAIPYRKLASVMFRVPIKALADEAAYARELAESDQKQGDGFFRLGAFYEDTLYAGFVSSEYMVHFDGALCKMAGIGGVCSDFDAPMKGAMKAIYSKAFQMMRKKGQYISHLYPFSENYYRQYGYDVSCQTVSWSIPIERFTMDRDGSIKAYDGSSKMQEDIRFVYEHFCQGKNMTVLLDADAWDSYFQKNQPYVSGISSFLHYNTLGKPDAFMTYTLENQVEKPQKLVVKNLWFTDFTGLKGILSYFTTQHPYCDRAVLPLPETLDLSPIIDSKGGFGKRVTQRTICNEGSSRIVDVEEILKLAAYKGSGQVCIKIYDDTYAPWNNDCFTVTFGEKTIVTRGGTPDIEMKITSFSSGILGRFTLDNLLLFPDVKVYQPQHLDQVFYKKTLYIEEHF